MGPLILLVLQFGWCLASGGYPSELEVSIAANLTPPVPSMWDPEHWPAYPDRMYILFRQAFLDVANSDAKIAYYFHTINRPTMWYAPTSYHTATPDPQAKMPKEMYRFDGFENLFNIVRETYEVRKKRRYEAYLAKMASTTTSDQLSDTTTEQTTDATSTEPTTVSQDFDVYVTTEGDTDYISLVASTGNPAEVYVVNKEIGSTGKPEVEDSDSKSEVYVVHGDSSTEKPKVYVLNEDSVTEKSEDTYVVDGKYEDAYVVGDSSTEKQENVYVVEDDSSTENPEEVYVMDVEVQKNEGRRRLTKRAGILLEDTTTSATTLVPETSSDSPDDVTPMYVPIPATSFSCRDKKYIPGFYADQETGCRIFHICRDKSIKDSYACPDGTTFDQATLSCGFNVNCAQTPAYYDMNAAVEDEAKRPSSKMADRLLQDILVAAIENVAAESYKVLE